MKTARFKGFMYIKLWTMSNGEAENAERSWTAELPWPAPVFHTHFHSWQLQLQGNNTFALACQWCHMKRKMKLPTVFARVFDAVSRLTPTYNSSKRAWTVSKADVRRAVDSLGLPTGSRSERARVWDIYASLHILLSLKAGRERGNLVVKSRALQKLIEARMWPDRLRTMPSTTRKRYVFMLDVVRLVPSQLLL